MPDGLSQHPAELLKDDEFDPMEGEFQQVLSLFAGQKFKKHSF